MNSELRHILVLTSWSSDEPLIQSYVIPYLEIIQEIHHGRAQFSLQTWEKGSAASAGSLPELSKRLRSLNGTLLPMCQQNFGLRAMISQALNFIKLLRYIRTHRIGTIHCFAPPAAAMGFILNRFSRTKLIVDSWEPHAEAMVETGTWTRSSLAFRILYYVEGCLSKRADVLIAASPSMIDYARSRWGQPRGIVLYRPACVDLTLFDPEKFNRISIRETLGIAQDAIVGVCVSKFGGLYLAEEAFHFFAQAERSFGEDFRMIIISASTEEDVSKWSGKAGLSAKALIHLTVPHQEVARWLTIADFAFNPQKPVPSKRYGTPVKDGEYWAMGLPLVILPDISDDSEIVVRERAGVVLQSCNPKDISQAILELRALMKSDPAPSKHIRSVAFRYRSFDIAIEAYRKAYQI